MKLLMDLRDFKNSNIEAPWFYYKIDEKMKTPWRFLTNQEIEEVGAVDFSNTKISEKRERMEIMIGVLCLSGGLATRKDVESSIGDCNNHQIANQTAQHIRVKKEFADKFKLFWIKKDEQKYFDDDVLVLVIADQ